MLRHLAEVYTGIIASGNRTAACLAFLTIGLTLSACNTAPQAVAAISGQEEAVTTPLSASAPTSTAAPAPPIVTSLDVTNEGFPSFEVQRPDELVTATATPSVTATGPTINAEAAATATVGESDDSGTNLEVTEPPPPTFTPPATPDESSDDHYWLQRPVAAGGTVWTDKHYPYGSTRGGELRPHHGVEFNVPYDTEILAAAPGIVRVAGSDVEEIYGAHADFYGNLVVIEHEFQYAGQSVFTLYGHLNEVLVSEGQQVAAQELLGLSGATGVADGPHMHFEVRLGANSYGSTRNPLLWLYPFPERGTIAGRVVWPDGSLAEGAPVSLNRVDGSSPYYASTTYTGDSLNADERWQENFALDDVVAGYYAVTVRVGDEKFTAETWVYPYRTSFVEIVLQ